MPDQSGTNGIIPLPNGRLDLVIADVADKGTGAALYMIVADIATWTVVDRPLFPNLMWLALVPWVAPAVAGLGLTTMVLVSARAEGFQDAYQIGGAIVIPILILVIGQATGVMYFSLGLVLLLGLLLWLLDGALLWFGARHFRRSRLIARQ